MLSAYQSWCRAPLWGPLLDFSFLCWTIALLLSWGALSDERMGLYFVAQSVSGQSRGALITIHYCLIWDYFFPPVIPFYLQSVLCSTFSKMCKQRRVPFPSPLTTRRDYGGSILTRFHTGMCDIRIFVCCVSASWVQLRSYLEEKVAAPVYFFIHI
jgi:hypothetical protein